MAGATLWGGIFLVYLTGAFLLFLQIRTYRRTRHKSLLWAATSQVFGLAYGATEISTYLLAQETSTRWTLFYVGSACLYVQCVIGAIGALLIFRAFEQALLRPQAAPSAGAGDGMAPVRTETVR